MKCFSITLAPSEYAAIGIDMPESWPEYPITVSANLSLNVLITFKLIVIGFAG